MTDSWWAYVERIGAGAAQKELAARSGIDAAAFSRWKQGMNRPRAEQVVQFARAFNRPPTEALVAAGYITEGEAAEAIEVIRDLGDVDTDALLNEIRRRIDQADAPIASAATRRVIPDWVEPINWDDPERVILSAPAPGSDGPRRRTTDMFTEDMRRLTDSELRAIAQGAPRHSAEVSWLFRYRPELAPFDNEEVETSISAIQEFVALDLEALAGVEDFVNANAAMVRLVYGRPELSDEDNQRSLDTLTGALNAVIPRAQASIQLNSPTAQVAAAALERWVGEIRGVAEYLLDLTDAEGELSRPRMDPNDLAELDRLQAVLHASRARMDAVDHARLDELHTQINQVVGDLDEADGVLKEIAQRATSAEIRKAAEAPDAGGVGVDRGLRRFARYLTGVADDGAIGSGGDLSLDWLSSLQPDGVRPHHGALPAYMRHYLDAKYQFVDDWKALDAAVRAAPDDYSIDEYAVLLRVPVDTEIWVGHLANLTEEGLQEDGFDLRGLVAENAGNLDGAHSMLEEWLPAHVRSELPSRVVDRMRETAELVDLTRTVVRSYLSGGQSWDAAARVLLRATDLSEAREAWIPELVAARTATRPAAASSQASGSTGNAHPDGPDRWPNGEPVYDEHWEQWKAWQAAGAPTGAWEAFRASERQQAYDLVSRFIPGQTDAERLHAAQDHAAETTNDATETGEPND